MATTSAIVRAEPRATRLFSLEVDWESDASGDASASFSGISGLIYGANIIPDSGGTQPTDAYDVTVTDADGLDLLGGNGADQSNSAAAYVPASCTLGGSAQATPRPVDGSLTVTIAGAGDTKGGKVVLLLENR